MIKVSVHCNNMHETDGFVQCCPFLVSVHASWTTNTVELYTFVSTFVDGIQLLHEAKDPSIPLSGIQALHYCKATV